MEAARPIAAAALLVAIASPAAAHHVMDGALPRTPLEGLLSGLGHPIIGLDHLAALIAVGCIASLLRHGASAAVVFVVAVIAGVALHLRAADLPAAETLVALTLVGLGLAALAARGGVGFAVLLFGLAGLVHGYALGESIVGAEPAPVYAYLAGLAVVQCALVLAAMWIARLMAARMQTYFPVRAAGAAVMCFGLVMLAQQVLA